MASGEGFDKGFSGNFVTDIFEGQIPETPSRCIGCPNRQLFTDELRELLMKKQTVLEAGVVMLDSATMTSQLSELIDSLSETFGPPPPEINASSLLVQIREAAENDISSIEDAIRNALANWAHFNDTCNGITTAYVKRGLAKIPVAQLCGHDIDCPDFGNGDVVPAIIAK